MTSDEATELGGAGTAKGKPPAFDVTMANQARMYDYMLGGKDHFAADRDAVETALKVYPEMAAAARSNRAFLGRAVRYLAGEAGIRQYLDIGTGIPTAGNTHEIAQAIAPESRIVYVDYDPIVLAHARALLTSHEDGATWYIDADLRDTDTILDQASQLLDFTRPVAVMLVLILHAIPDSDNPYAIVARLMDAVPSGSYLTISLQGSELVDPDTQARLDDISGRMVQQDFTFRSNEQVMRFFEGADLVEPGLVRVEEWRPAPGADNTSKSFLLGAVGRKR
jgi:hypothetical protein